MSAAGRVWEVMLCPDCVCHEYISFYSRSSGVNHSERVSHDCSKEPVVRRTTSLCQSLNAFFLERVKILIFTLYMYLFYKDTISFVVQNGYNFYFEVVAGTELMLPLYFFFQVIFWNARIEKPCLSKLWVFFWQDKLLFYLYIF